MTENTVTLSLHSYNQTKAENTRCSLFLDRLFEEAVLRPDYSGIDFDTRQIEELIKLVYPERYKKKVSHLKTSATKIANAKARLEQME